MSFEAQEQPYSIDYSINVSPETATNKNVTIVSSNPEVINVSTYDSSAVTFTIEGEGEAEVTIASQDNPDIKTVYSIEVTPAPTPFAPNNNILVEPTRGEAKLKFFPIDGNDRNYVYADLSSSENLVHITYHGNCDNELCKNLFKSSAFKSRLGRQISEYIDIHGIPESGALEFTSSMWESISDYLEGGDTTVTDIIDELDQGGVIEPAGYCQARLVSVEEGSVTLTVGESTTVGFQIEYDCENPDISNIVIDGGDENVVAVTPSVTLGECSVALSGVSEGHTMVTISDGTTLLGIRIEVEPVPAPELESITLDSGGVSEITMGENTYFTISYSPNDAEVNLEPFGDYGNAQVRIKNDGKLRVNSTTAGNITVGVMDISTGIRSNTLQLSVVPPALQEITFTNDTTDLQIGTTYYFPITTSPRYATATLQAYGMYTDGVDANVSISQNNLVIEPLAVSNIEVGVEDAVTGIQSNTLTFDITEGGGECPVHISDYTAEELNIPLSETYSSTFTLSYDCATPDYSNLSVTSSDENVALVTLYPEEEHFDIEAVGEGESEITFTDGENTYSFNVYVESGEPIDGDGAIRLDNDEMEGGYGIAGFNYSGTLEDLMVYARNIDTGEEYSSDVIYVETGEQEESEWKYYISVKYYYPESADDLIDEFEIVFAYHSGEELAVWPVYAYIDYNFEESEAIESRVNVLRRLSVSDGTLVASYRGDTIDIANPGNPDPGSLEFFAWVNSVTPYDEWYTDNRLICGETGYLDEAVYTYLDNFKPLWVTHDVAVPKYLFNLEGESGDAGRDPDNPIELSTHSGHTLIRFNYHNENATDFSHITVEVNDESVLRAEIVHTNNGEGVIEVEAVGPGRGELRLNCTDMEGRYTFSTETLYFSVSDEHDFAD